MSTPIRLRRAVAEPRLELMPLLDVVFLLLTFFIYAMAVMVRADALDVELSPVAGTGGPSGAVEHVLRIEADGAMTYNGEALSADALPAVLDALASDRSGPTLFVALAQAGVGEDGITAVDRAPVLWSLLQKVETAGLTRVSIVGPPAAP